MSVSPPPAPSPSSAPERKPGTAAFSLAAILAACIALYNYMADPGIHGTLGAGLALFGCVALAFAGLLLLLTPLPGWVRGVFRVLIVLGLIGTGLAAWFLHAWAVFVLIVVAAVAFVFSFFL